MQFLDRMSRNRKLDRLVEQWVEYRDTVSRLGGQAGATPEQERQFLALKASLSAFLPLLSEGQNHGSLNTEALANVRGMTDLMNSQISLSGVTPGDDFLNRWHTHYLYLNKYKGMAQNARPARGMVGATAPSSMPGDSFYKGGFAHRYVRPIFNNWLTRFVVRLAVVAGLIILVAKVLNVDLRQAPEWGRQVAGSWWGPGNGTPTVASGGGSDSLAAKKPGAVTSNRTVTINGGQRTGKFTPDGSGIFKPPQTPGVITDTGAAINRLIPRPVKEFLSPVTQKYGVEVTVAMVGIGLLLLAYMIFGRAR